MKSTRLILAFVILVTVSANLAAFERESLIKTGTVTHGGFGGVSTRTGSINGRTETMVGVKAAWLVNHNTYLGVAGFGTEDSVNNTDQNMGYGGIIVGYIFEANKMFHYNLEIMAGAGGLSNEKNHDVKDYEVDSFAVFEPSLNIGIAITKFADASIGVSYRFIQETDQENLSNTDLSGWSVNTSLVFGRF